MRSVWRRGGVARTVRLVALFPIQFDILVCLGGDLSFQRRRSDDFPQSLESVVEIAGVYSLGRGISSALSILFDAERGQISRNRALEMPRRHDVLLPLGRCLLVPLSPNGFLVFVGSQHDADAVFLASFARRTRHF